MRLHRIPFFLFIFFSLAYAKKGKDKSPEAEHVGTNSEKYTVYPFPNPVTLDISNVSNDFVHTEAQYHDWVTYVSSPVTEKNMVEVRDGNSSIWTGDGRTEKCFSVTRHIKGDLELLDLNLFTRAGKCSRKYFEKSGGSWKEMSLEEYEKNKPKSDTYTLLDGIEFKVKVEYIPVENPKEPEFTPTEDEGKKNSKTPQKQPQANAQPAAKSPEAQTVADPPPEPVQPTPQGGAQTKSADKPAGGSSAPEQTESKEASTETSDDNTSKTILDKDVKVVKPTVETYKSDQGDLTTLDIKKPNLHVINLRETLDKNEVRNRIYGRTGMSPITSVVDGSFQFYKGSTEVRTVLSFSKGNSTLLFVQYKQRLDGKWVDYFENSGGSWKSITQEEYHTKYKAMKSVEILKQLAKPHQFKTKPLPKRDTSAKNAGSNTPETGKVKLQIDGIDSETYAIERSIEDNVVFVKCSSKIGKTPSEFLYGPDKIWSGKEGFNLVSSTSYLEDNLPKMAVLKIIKDKSYEFVYTYKNGDAWEEEDEENHKARLEEMKQRGAKNPPKLPDDIIPPKAPEPEDKQEEKPAPTTPQESKEETSASPPPAASETAVEGTTFELSSPNPSSAVDHESAVDGVTYTCYFPDGLFFNKVVDGEVTTYRLYLDDNKTELLVATIKKKDNSTTTYRYDDGNRCVDSDKDTNDRQLENAEDGDGYEEEDNNDSAAERAFWRGIPERQRKKLEEEARRSVKVDDKPWDMAFGAMKSEGDSCDTIVIVPEEQEASNQTPTTPEPVAEEQPKEDEDKDNEEEENGENDSFDIIRPNKSICDVFDNIYDTLPSRHVVPKRNVFVTRLTSGKDKIWVGEQDEHLLYATVHIKCRKPVFANICKESPKSRFLSLVKTGKEWVDCTSTASEKFKALESKEPQGDS
ncbi:hypothetical protein BEWA_041550 [Theileria equi strain WA]|uniref:Signal peptide containing protein n=1 Tax=Theileria equi strain WA TaxID=1537102 RepID=L1LFA3_THEEQ|nr:hypothetical protein BEWA_041550 [Theileria equi strain WA]EKX74117.1 hypothetical protein BEWA_041550 [Theileria equi strain WA]|eukprot:XP_004833569.1 hypothetical protein BEWA_041550 [Theileria equi strain WA]